MTVSLTAFISGLKSKLLMILWALMDTSLSAGLNWLVEMNNSPAGGAISVYSI